MSKRSLSLVRELLALYAKYGPETFDAAIRDLRQGDFIKPIAAAADTIAGVPYSVAAKSPIGRHLVVSRKSKQELLAEEVRLLRSTGIKRDSLAADLIERLMRREILGTPASLRDYMAFIGMPVSERQIDRYDNIRSILKYLTTLPERESAERIDAADKIKARNSSLQRWADIIVRTDPSR